MAVVGGPRSAWLTAPPLLPRPPHSPALRRGWKMRLGWGWGPTQGPWGLRKSHLSPSPPLLFPRPGAFAHMVESMGGEGRARGLGQQQILTISSHRHLETTSSPPLAPGGGRAAGKPNRPFWTQRAGRAVAVHAGNALGPICFTCVPKTKLGRAKLSGRLQMVRYTVKVQGQSRDGVAEPHSLLHT